jgi:hypothetical protein
MAAKLAFLFAIESPAKYRSCTLFAETTEDFTS